MKYDIAVAFRGYPRVSRHTPPIFTTDKLKLSELCARSFKRSLGNLNARIWVVLDGSPPEFEEVFKELWPAESLTFIRHGNFGDEYTLKEQTRILISQTDSDIVYYNEDDYFYLPNQLEDAVRFMREHKDVDFVTPYDHPDYHRTVLHRKPEQVISFGGKIWSKRNSTGHTFMARRSSLIECQDVFLQNCRSIGPDFAKWLALTKMQVFNPLRFIEWLFKYKFGSASIVLAWFFYSKQLLFGRRYTVYSPSLSIATHMVAGYEALGIDWTKEFVTVMKECKIARPEGVLQP